MTTGHFDRIPPSQVIVRREDRQRREIEVSDLVQSIARCGQINPITVTRELVLVAGERRLTAIKELGLPYINVQYAEELSDLDLFRLEFEENARRRDLTWQETADSIGKYHIFCVEQDPAWTYEKTAEALGYTLSAIQKYIAIQVEIAKGGERAETLLAIQDKATAYNTVQRMKTRELQSIDLSSVTGEEAAAPATPLINADFCEWVKTYDGPKFNFLHCDLPYGINFDKSAANNSANKERYDDSFETYETLIEALADVPLADSAHIMFWFSMRHYPYTILALQKQGWKINPHPLVWFKSDNSGILSDPKRDFRRVSEFALFGSRGDRPIVRAKSNTVAVPRGDVMHPSTKAKAALRHFLPAFVDHTTHMLDPTCGSGYACKVATELNAARVVGVELSPQLYADAVQAWEIDL